MKKQQIFKNIALLSISLSLTFAACSSDFTQLDPQGSPSYENFWKTPQDAIEASNSLYQLMDENELFGRGFFWFINASDDMVTGRLNATADNIKNFNMTGDESYVNNIYHDCYKVIRRANDIILNVPQMDLSQSLKDRILGEAYFMRGFHYFWLAHTYGDNGQNGGVPIVTQENMSEPAGSFSRPKSVIDNYKHIIEDLTKASELLPLFTQYTGEDFGRAHKDAALAYIAKTNLYWAQYDSSRYQQVIIYSDAVTNSGSGRALINTGNPKQDFRLLHSSENNWTQEYIWSVNSGVEGGSILPGCFLENKGWGSYNGWGYFTPTQDLYESYEKGDARLGITLLVFGDEFTYFGQNKRYQSENSLSGLQFNKYMYEYSFENALGNYINMNGDKPTTKYNVPLMRYAEVLLMKAEAQIMLGQNADQALNQIRQRAGLAPKSGVTLVDLKQERRSELAGEFANRHFDLVRWGDAKQVYSKPLYGRIHQDRSNPDSPFSIQEIWKARNFDDSFMHVWPIPNKAVQSSGISQNIGW
ncbi:RagB/SusD family nutrient uptake outer membrane protein [Myroides sp. LJL119]